MVNTYDRGVHWSIFKGSGRNAPEYTLLTDGQKVRIRILINPDTDREYERLVDMSVSDLRNLIASAQELFNELETKQ